MTLFIATQVVATVLTWAPNAGTFRAAWRENRLLDNTYLLLSSVTALAVLVALYTGVQHHQRIEVLAEPGTSPEAYERGTYLLSRAAFVGYALWVAVASTRGLSVQSVAAALLQGQRGASDANRVALAPVPGVSQLTQLAPLAAAACACQIAFHRGKASDSGRLRRMLIILVGISALRAAINSERLALLEVVSAASVAYVLAVVFGRGVLGFSASSRRRMRLVLVSVPFVAVALFSLFESSRSWTYYSQTSQQSVLSFGAERLMGYYATSSNNSAMLMGQDVPMLRLPTEDALSSSFLQDVPGAHQILPRYLPSYRDLLRTHTSEEFNNPGFLAPLYDFGIAGGIGVWIVVAVTIGVSYGRARRGSIGGILSYSLLLLCLLESPRVFLFGGSRLIFPLVVVAVWRRRVERAGHRARPERMAVRGRQPALSGGSARHDR